MPLQDPVAVYNAGTNVEAILVRDVLTDAGIEAFVVEDLSQVGAWVGGLVPEIHKPQVYVDRADMERARPVLTKYDERASQLRKGDRADDASPIEMVCEECDGDMTFPASQRGSVQECPHCGAYVDVGESDSVEDEDDLEKEEHEASEDAE